MVEPLEERDAEDVATEDGADPASPELPDLYAAGDVVGEPDAAAEDRARTRLAAVQPVADLGRLGELALWWAAVRGDDRAGPAASVVHVGNGSGPGAARPGTAVRDVPLDPPGDVPAALDWGTEQADRLADSGADLVVVTLAGTLASRVLAAELMGLDPVEACGWPLPRGLEDEAWMREVDAVREGLRRTRGLRGQPADLLVAAGSPSLAAVTTLVLQLSVRRTPVLLDGAGSCAAAVLARRAARIAAQWWLVTHRGADPLHERMLTSLGLTPVTDLGIRLEDGTAARPALAVLDVAAGLLTSNRDDLGDDEPGR